MLSTPTYIIARTDNRSQGVGVCYFAAAKNPVRPHKNTAEGGCGGNSAVFLQKIEASPAALLVRAELGKKVFFSF